MQYFFELPKTCYYMYVSDLFISLISVYPYNRARKVGILMAYVRGEQLIEDRMLIFSVTRSVGMVKRK